jgi:hypothetical protein
MQRMERELNEFRARRAQLSFFEEENELIDRLIKEKELELARRTRHLEEIREVVEKERDRVLHRVIPKRFTLGSDVAVFPVALEVRLPAGGPQ